MLACKTLYITRQWKTVSLRGGKQSEPWDIPRLLPGECLQATVQGGGTVEERVPELKRWIKEGEGIS